MVVNRSLVFAIYADGIPVPGENLYVKEGSFDLEQALPPISFLFQGLYASLDPYMRQIMDPPAEGEEAYLVPGMTFEGPVIGKVLSADSEARFKAGDLIFGWTKIQEFSIIADDDDSGKTFRLLNNPSGIDPMSFLGPLGSPGLTGYSAFYELGQPRPGETILISAACGSVGQMVGQLAKREGLRVLGTVGSDDKVNVITNRLGFDGGINYRSADLAKELARLAPKGVDIYFDNVGGVVLEAAIDAMNTDGRIVACGFASEYNLPAAERHGIRNTGLVVTKRLSWRGFSMDLPGGFLDKYRKDHQANIQDWIADGSFKYITSVTDGIENAAHGMVNLFRGQNIGKAVLDICGSQSKQTGNYNGKDATERASIFELQRGKA